MSKPHVILIPGAWHLPDSYRDLIQPLKQAGYPVTGVTLTSVIPPGHPPDVSFEGDVAATRKAIQDAADNGEDVAVLMHSYSGFPAGEAVRGLSKEERGGKGGVTRLIYLCAFAPDVGLSLLDLLGGNWLPWWVEDEKIGSTSIKCFDTEKIFYNDLPADSPKVSQAQSELLRMSEGAFKSKATVAPWKTIPSVYIICTQDAAIPPQVQEGMASQPGGNWVEVMRLDASHIPFLSKPKETAEAVMRAAG